MTQLPTFLIFYNVTLTNRHGCDADSSTQQLIGNRQESVPDALNAR